MPYLEREELKELTDEIAKLKTELAAKEAQILELREALRVAESRTSSPHTLSVIREALATKPSTEYLKAWLGEPVGWLYEHDGMIHDDFNPPIFSIKELDWKEPWTGTKLYAPKGLEK